MKSLVGPKREVKLNFWRLLAAEWKVNSSIKGNARQEKYMSLFHAYEFNNYSISKSIFSLTLLYQMIESEMKVLKSWCRDLLEN